MKLDIIQILSCS